MIPKWTRNDPQPLNDPQTGPEMIPALKWSQTGPKMIPSPWMIPKLDPKWSPAPEWSQTGPEMIPSPWMIPKLDPKWSPAPEWSQTGPEMIPKLVYFSFFLNFFIYADTNTKIRKLNMQFFYLCRYEYENTKIKHARLIWPTSRSDLNPISLLKDCVSQ